jgi:FSR family fosmidomycin resistance protein-like MFS transporter
MLESNLWQSRLLRSKALPIMHESAPTRLNLKILLFLSLGHLVTDIYQGALPAILPYLKTHLSLSYAYTGVILMTANFTSSILQPLFGYLSDRREKLFLLPLGCLAAGVGLSLLPLSGLYGLTLVLVVISGLGVASYHPEGYKTAYFFTGPRPATGMSVFSVGGNLGFALGPLIALTIILGFHYLPIMLCFCLIFLGLLPHYWKMLHEPKPPHLQSKTAATVVSPGTYLALALIIAVVIMRSWIQLGLMTFIPFYYIGVLKGDPLYSGTLVSVFLLGGVAGTLGGAPLADRWGHKRLLTLSMLLTSLLFPLVRLTSGLWLFVVLALVGMVLISSFTVTVVMAQRLLPRHLGAASGLMVGFAIGAGGLGVTILGIVADHYGVPAALNAIIFLPIIGMMLSLGIKEPHQA